MQEKEVSFRYFINAAITNDWRRSVSSHVSDQQVGVSTRPGTDKPLLFSGLLGGNTQLSTA